MKGSDDHPQILGGLGGLGGLGRWPTATREGGDKTVPTPDAIASMRFNVNLLAHAPACRWRKEPENSLGHLQGNEKKEKAGPQTCRRSIPYGSPIPDPRSRHPGIPVDCHSGLSAGSKQNNAHRRLNSSLRNHLLPFCGLGRSSACPTIPALGRSPATRFRNGLLPLGAGLGAELGRPGRFLALPSTNWPDPSRHQAGAARAFGNQ